MKIRTRNQKGATMVEYSLVLLLFLTALYAIMDSDDSSSLITSLQVRPAREHAMRLYMATRAHMLQPIVMFRTKSVAGPSDLIPLPSQSPQRGRLERARSTVAFNRLIH